MSTNKTDHFKLHTWVGTDQFKMSEFNENFKAIDAAIPKMEFGSYIGNGNFGVNNPNTLTFGFTPKIVLMESYATGGRSIVAWFYGFPYGEIETAINGSRYVGLTWSENTLSWYCISYSNPQSQLNSAGREYHYCAIG